MSSYSLDNFNDHIKELHQILDLDKAVSFTGLKKECELLEYLLVIRQEFFSGLHHIKKSILTQNRDLLKKQAHSLKGLSNATGFYPLMNMMAYADTHAFHIEWDDAQTVWGNAFLCFYSLRDKIDEYITSHQLYPQMGLSTVNCLVAAQQNTIRNILNILLGNMGCACIHHAANEMEALEIVNQNKIDIVLTTCTLQTGSGLSLLQHIRTQQTHAIHSLPLALIAGKSDQHYFRDAIRLDVNGCTGKQFTQTKLAALLLRLMDYRPITPCWMKQPSDYSLFNDSQPQTTTNDILECSESINDDTVTVENVFYTKPGAILAEDLTDNQNRVIYKRGHSLSPLELDNVKDLLQFGGAYHNLQLLQN